MAVRAAASYITGSHAVKVGWNHTSGYLDESLYQLNDGRSYRFNTVGGVTTPNLITMRGNYDARTNLDHDMGLYAQDRWTMSRLTVSGAIRYDWFQTSFPEQTLGPVPLAPNRNITFPAADNINWKDLTYRSGFSYDLFGTGKTALKFSYNKYLLGQTLNGLGRDPNPAIVAGAVAPTRYVERRQPRLHPGLRPDHPPGQRRVRVGQQPRLSVRRSRRRSSTKISSPASTTGRATGRRRSASSTS